MKYDILYVEKELFPYLPAFFEGYLRKLGVKIIADYDDAVFTLYDPIPFLRHKIPCVMSTCAAVVVGNQYLADYAAKYNSRVYIIPTCVDVKKYRVKPYYSMKEDVVVIGWIGSPATEHYLRLLEEPLKELSKEFKILLKCIGVSEEFDLPGIRLRKVPWSEATEAEELTEIDVGVMPLTDDPFSRGKCGLKLLQYMVCGIPVVGSPVGGNKEIIRESENGFLASTGREWVEKLRILISSEELRARMGREGRAVVEKAYSLDAGLEKLLKVFRDVLVDS
ncbi:glycosyltransferase family 4 protein [Desulfothermobacter acidiphilus]|uniref:glycosyltransferase family 4 protein n=1 Tax=Desulfothermobacter acidiphilus TaxID=1938353 RepID=UPI003F8CDDF0